MGVVCYESPTGGSQDQLVDLYPPTMHTDDMLSMFESQLPFCKTSMLVFRMQLDLAHRASGRQGTIRRDAFIQMFGSTAWNTLKDRHSVQAQFFQSVFATENETDVWSYRDLLLFGIIHCQDKPDAREKATALLHCVTGDSSENKQLGTTIMGNDKGFDQVLNQLFTFASLTVVREQAGEDSTPLYDEAELEQIKTAFETLIDDSQDSFLEQVFDHKDHLSHDQFCEKVGRTAKWVLNPILLRDRIWKAANIPSKHIVEQDW